VWRRVEPEVQSAVQCLPATSTALPIADIRHGGPSFPSPALLALSFAGEKFIIIDPRIWCSSTEKELLLPTPPSRPRPIHE
jgi:hypothetical protein